VTRYVDLETEAEWRNAEQAILKVIALGQALQQLQSEHFMQAYCLIGDLSGKAFGAAEDDNERIPQDLADRMHEMSGILVHDYTCMATAQIQRLLEELDWILELPSYEGE